MRRSAIVEQTAAATNGADREIFVATPHDRVQINGRRTFTEAVVLGVVQRVPQQLCSDTNQHLSLTSTRENATSAWRFCVVASVVRSVARATDFSVSVWREVLAAAQANAYLLIRSIIAGRRRCLRRSLFLNVHRRRK
jgi:hypothetical protein